jgi:hypothetical protein
MNRGNASAVSNCREQLPPDPLPPHGSQVLVPRLSERTASICSTSTSIRDVHKARRLQPRSPSYGAVVTFCRRTLCGARGFGAGERMVSGFRGVGDSAVGCV